MDFRFAWEGRGRSERRSGGGATRWADAVRALRFPAAARGVRGRKVGTVPAHKMEIATISIRCDLRQRGFRAEPSVVLVCFWRRVGGVVPVVCVFLSALVSIAIAGAGRALQQRCIGVVLCLETIDVC